MSKANKDQELNNIDIKALKRLRKSQKKSKKILEKEIQGCVKTKRKVSNFLKKFESMDTKDPDQESTKSRANSSKIESNSDKTALLNRDKIMDNGHEIFDISSSDLSTDETQEILLSRTQPSSSSGRTAATPYESLSVSGNSGSDLICIDSDDSLMNADSKEYPSMRKFDDWIYYRKLDSDSVLVSVNPFKFLYFSGKCVLKVLKGVVEIYGHQLSPTDKEVRAFSPKGHSSLLCITGISRHNEFDHLEFPEKWKPLLTREEVEDLPGAVLVIEAFDNEWAEGLRNVSPVGETLVGPSITGIGPARLPKMKNFMEKLGFQFIPQFMWNKNRLFDTSPAWDEVFQEVGSAQSHPSRVSIFGGKGVGKSTFTRWVVNKFLSSGCKAVLYVDLDPGQAEFTPPGVVSACLCEEPLIGPNFTHLRQPIRSIFLGGINVSDFPVTYLNAVVQLFEFVSEEENLASIPWVINTMGFSQGLGVHLAVGTIKIFKPTSVVQLQVTNERRSYPFDLNFPNVTRSKPHFIEKNLPKMYTSIHSEYRFLKIESVCNREDNVNSNPWGASPKSLRENVIISYFSELIGSTNDFNFASVTPWNISISEIAIGTMNSELTYEGTIRTLIGNLVALLEFSPECIEENRQFVSEQPASSRTNTGRCYIKKADSYENIFHGYGIVRAYDERTRMLHVISPVDEKTLKIKVNAIIAAGNVGLPIQFYIGNGENSAPVEAPYVMDVDGKSKLHTASKKYFSSKRVTHSVLKNSLL